MHKKYYRLYLIILWGILIPASVLAQKSFLSNLRATAETPLYTTYAAQMERSEFALDEGYHFIFYKPEQGIQFTTDTAGNLLLGFKKGDRFVYRLNDMYRKPVITTSYTDIVKYHYEPFRNIRVDATFLVYSSHLALLDVNIYNNSNEKTRLQVYTILQNKYRAFNKIKHERGSKAILFNHQELPDGWVTSHDLPYVDKVHDVLLFSEKPDSQRSYHSFDKGSFTIPRQVEMEKKEQYLVWGKITDSGGQTCRENTQNAHLMGFINGNKKRIITETAPRWGDTAKNITGYGNWGLELGNFGTMSRNATFTIRMQCESRHQLAEASGRISDFEKHRLQKNLQLHKTGLPPAPDNLAIYTQNDNRNLKLTWRSANANVSYSVYRRNYSNHFGYYERIARNLHKPSFTDHNAVPDSIYGYLVTATDKNNLMSMPSREVNSVKNSSFLADFQKNGRLQKADAKNMATVIVASRSLNLSAGKKHHLRIVRGVSRPEKSHNSLINESRALLNIKLQPFIIYDEQLYSKIPHLNFSNRDKEMLYWNAFTLMRQVMLPPEGQLSHNYYVFSREPTWGWGHGGQVFHESLTMLAYAFMDPQSAMNSQRVFQQVQQKNGYINYRTGSYLNEKIKVEGQNTTSAPWYAWQNWMVYKITRDKQFLSDMYESSKKFYQYYVSTRDTDHDGLCEWGGHAVLESVRDAQVAVWDKVGWPTHFDAVDLNSMLVSEAKALSKMAVELGKEHEAGKWRNDAIKRTRLINDIMWDKKTEFYYQVDKKDNDFTYKKANDLKRQEIIGFLPLWAGVASKIQASRLVQKLKNPDKFWRKYGIPSLSADDPYYNPKGYWNGPVWVEWNYLIEIGLLKYGYRNLAKKLVDKVSLNMISQLKKDHTLWEFYSPDNKWGGYHQTYIWAGLISRMMMDIYEEN